MLATDKKWKVDVKHQISTNTCISEICPLQNASTVVHRDNVLAKLNFFLSSSSTSSTVKFLNLQVKDEVVGISLTDDVV